MAPFVVTIVSFITFVYIDDANEINANVIFVSLSLFGILRMPMGMFPMVITMIMQSMVSVKRINDFLNAEDIETTNITHNTDGNYFT